MNGQQNTAGWGYRQGAASQAQANMAPWASMVVPDPHGERMKALIKADPQMGDTLSALCSLTGYRLESQQITGGPQEVVGGQVIIWRVVSQKWNLEVVWLDTPAPVFQGFQEAFAKLGDAVAAKREKLLAEGKPLPAEPVDAAEMIRRQMDVIRGLQSGAQSFPHVFDQRAFANQAGLQSHAMTTAAQNQYGTVVAPPVADTLWGNTL